MWLYSLMLCCLLCNAGLPVEAAAKFKAPAVPPPCSRDHAVHAVLELETTTKTLPVSPLHRYACSGLTLGFAVFIAA
jgi:hypothetical protein